MVSRVTNSMLRNTLLSNLNTNLGRVGRLQNQLSSGRQWAHISDNPSALIFGQAARNRLSRIDHFQQSVGTARDWLTQTESGVRELQETLGNVYEEIVQAGGTMTPSDKLNISRVVGQMRNHYLDNLNTTFGDRFIFGGFNTPGYFAGANPPPNIRPFTMDSDGNLLFNGFNISQFDGMPFAFLSVDFTPAPGSNAIRINDAEAEDRILAAMGMTRAEFDAADFDVTMADAIQFHRLEQDIIEFEVGPGIMMPVTMNGIDLVMFRTRDPFDEVNPTHEVFRNSFSLLTEIYEGLKGDWNNTGRTITTDELTLLIGQVQDAQNHLLARTAEVGGRQRRLDLIDARFDQDWLNYEAMRSNAEDADIAEVIMNLRMAETVYQAALSAGARVIMPTLMDFLR